MNAKPVVVSRALLAAWSIGWCVAVVVGSVGPAAAQGRCFFTDWRELTTPGSTDEISALGRTDFGPAAAAVPSRGEVYVFARAREGGALLYRAVNDGRWTPVLAFPGGAPMASGPAAATVSGSGVLVVVRGVNGSIFQNRFNPAARAWRGWIELPGDGLSASTPSVVSHGSVAAGFAVDEYYITGADGRVRVNYYTYPSLAGPASWSGWTEVPGTRANGAPAALIFDGRTHLYVRDVSDRVLENVNDGGAWRGWRQVDAALTLDTPAAAVLGDASDSELHLFVRGLDNRVYTYVRRTGSASGSGWAEVSGGGRTTAAPGVAAHDGQLLLFVRWYGDRVYTNRCVQFPE